MKKVLLLCFVLYSVVCFSQKYYDETNFDYFIDYSSNTLKLSYQTNKIEGTFTKVVGKDYYNYLLVEGNNGIHWVIKPSGNSSFYGLEILKGNFEDIVKEFNKGRSYKKVEVLFSNLPSTTLMNDFSLIPESTMTKKLEKIKSDVENKILSQKFQDDLISGDLIGTYKIKILQHSNLDYKSLNTLGKITITEIGVTIETDIPSMDLLRGVYLIEYSNPSEGNISCKINKGFGDSFSVRLNKTNKVGGLTIMNGKSTSTTIFTIIE